MAKYDPLLEFLCRADDGPVDMTFEEIGGLVGGLPEWAASWPAWWANETAGSKHVQAHAWLGSGVKWNLSIAPEGASAFLQRRGDADHSDGAA